MMVGEELQFTIRIFYMKLRVDKSVCLNKQLTGWRSAIPVSEGRSASYTTQDQHYRFLATSDMQGETLNICILYRLHFNS